METVKKILTTGKHKFFVRNIEENYHTQFGYVTSEDLKKESGTVVKSHSGHEFILMDATFIDQYSKMKRGPQIIPDKDIGAIILTCGITRDSVIVDAGAGSGGLCIALGMIAKQVYTFDVREDHLAVVNKNLESLGVKNVVAKLHNVYESIPHKDVDVITFDLPEPWEAVDNAVGSLKVGGWLVSYSPCIPQVGDFVNKVHDTEQLEHIKTIEIVQRDWEVKGRKIRPISRTNIHSGFLSFARKVKN